MITKEIKTLIQNASEDMYYTQKLDSTGTKDLKEYSQKLRDEILAYLKKELKF